MKRSDVFQTIEPPPAGWTRLRASLDQRAGRRWVWAGPVALAGALMVALWLRPAPEPHPDLLEAARGSVFAEALGLGAQEEVTVSGGAAVRVASTDERVVLYRVATLQRR